MSLKRFIFLFVVIFSQVVFSQKKSASGSDASVIVPNEDLAIILTNVNGATSDIEKAKPPPYLSTGNGILIQQVGDYNVAYVNVTSKTMDIQINQEGDYNFYEFAKMSGGKVNVKVEQKGESNNTMNNALYSQYNMNMETMQNGNDLTIQTIGANSISSNMKITQTGSGASVIVISN
ncbi:hypothetical protein [Flavobacterium xinjiangense]|uniref:Curlin associated repeat-containing protein n=1 Tax=Flavobacterium xinjiangense TaxID=178356 RepID=A0A1M7PHU7_9FLAO|nr:hypothetical protein [Flavobacterium xinjiangense]SHN16319.1 hypothetical protein SAMN05216269_11744 [Flavobacterium xinjiangense]